LSCVSAITTGFCDFALIAIACCTASSGVSSGWAKAFSMPAIWFTSASAAASTAACE